MTKNIMVLGAFMGDEGKGRIVHYMSKDFDYVVRTSGGDNCGHVVYTNGKKYVHHLVPSIDFSRSNAKGFLSSGMAINLNALYNELLILENDFPGVSKRIIVDPDAFLVLPEHLEEDRSITKIGTTNRGIGPCYRDKVARKGEKVDDFLEINHPDIEKLKDLGVQFKYVLELYDEFKSSNILFEGSQGVLLDLNAGIYPYVSCGDATASSIYTSGFNFIKVDDVYGVVKCYATKVGGGIFPTKIEGEEEERIRQLGNERGSTTGRNRQIGYLDLPALKYASRRSGITKLIITKFDILDGMDKVPVCNSYGHEVYSGQDFFKAKPEYIDLPGWRDAKNISELKPFINYVENYVGVPVEYISCGVNEEDILKNE